MTRLQSHEDRLDMVATHAWETWTKNGLDLDDDAREQTIKSVRDAAANVFTDDMDDDDWLSATLARLNPNPPA